MYVERLPIGNLERTLALGSIGPRQEIVGHIVGRAIVCHGRFHAALLSHSIFVVVKGLSLGSIVHIGGVALFEGFVVHHLVAHTLFQVGL